MKTTFRDLSEVHDLPTFSSIKWIKKDDKKHQYFFSNSKLLCLIKRKGKQPYLDLIHVVFDNRVDRRGIHLQVAVTGLVGGSDFFDFLDWDKVTKFAVVYGRKPCTIQQAEKKSES